VRKHASEPSPGSSARGSYVVDVTYRHEGRVYTSSYAMDRSGWENVRVGDAMEMMLLPREPRLAQRADVVRGDAPASGFIIVDR